MNADDLKRQAAEAAIDEFEKVEAFIGAELKEAIVVKGKFERSNALSALKEKVAAEFTTADGDETGTNAQTHLVVRNPPASF